MGRPPVRVARLFVSAFAALGVLAYAAAAVVTLADVVGRRFGVAVPGVVDLVQLFVLAGAWLVIPYAFMVRGHVSVDLLTERLTVRGRSLVEAAGALVAIAVLAPATWKAWETLELQMRFGDRSQQLGIPMVWYWAPLIFGMALSVVVAAALLVVALRRVATAGVGRGGPPA